MCSLFCLHSLPEQVAHQSASNVSEWLVFGCARRSDSTGRKSDVYEMYEKEREGDTCRGAHAELEAAQAAQEPAAAGIGRTRTHSRSGSPIASISHHHPLPRRASRAAHEEQDMDLRDNQYLRPEDLPITDAKKSPLALLAMTCSNIGADVLGAGKPMIAFERSKKSRSDAGDSIRSDSANSDKIQANSIDSNRSNSRNSTCANDVTRNCSPTGQKISFKPYEDNPKSENRDQHRSARTGALTNNNNDDEKGCINGSRKRSCDTLSTKRSPGESSPKRSSSSHSENNHNNKSSSSSASSSSPSNVISYTSTGLLELSKNHQLSKAAADPSLSFPSSSHLSHYPPHPHQDHHHSLHPSHMPATCRDPLCPGCNISSLTGYNPASANCCNGSSACSHTKTASDHPFAFPPAINPLSHHLNRFSNGIPSQKPFPCHWTANGSYCGKSFATCEELLQHLKTHTLSSNTSSPYSGLGSYYSQALGAAAIRPYGLDDYRYNPYKISGPGSAAAAAAAAAAFQRPPVSLASASGYPMMSPSMSMYPPGQHSSLSSYYALLHGRLAGHGSLH